MVYVVIKFFCFAFKDPNFDFPYPPGVRRNKVKRPNANDSSAETEENIVDDLFNLTESDSASFTEYVYDRSHISRPSNQDTPDTDREDTKDGSGNTGSDETQDTGSGLYGSEYNNGDKGTGVFVLGKPQKQNRFIKKNMKNTNKEELSTKKNVVSKKKLVNSKKVQVAKQETATQRVQVNAGYDNPDIPCLSQGCSGVLLKWVLTFYGTYD